MGKTYKLTANMIKSSTGLRLFQIKRLYKKIARKENIKPKQLNLIKQVCLIGIKVVKSHA